MDVLKAPLNVWDKSSIRPGPVGSVGDCLIQVRYKQSAPDLASRYEKGFSKGNSKYYGSNVSDGRSPGFSSGGGVAITLRKPLGYRQGFKTAVGWVHEDLRPVDRARTSISGQIGQYGWETKVARTYRAKTTGDSFLPLPFGYQKDPSLVPRGSQIPQIVAESSGTGTALPAVNKPVVDFQYGTNGTTQIEGGAHQVPAYTVNKDWFWTAPANDPRRLQDAKKYTHYVHGIHKSVLGNWTYDWLDDTKEPQPILDLSQGQILGSYVASHEGGIGRPKNEPIPWVAVAGTSTVVSKPTLEALEPPKKETPPGKKELQSTVR